MEQIFILGGFFASVLALVMITGTLVQRWRSAEGPEPESGQPGEGPLWTPVAAIGRLMLPGRRQSADKVRRTLFRAGYRAPHSIEVFYGIQVIAAAGLSFLAWIAGSLAGAGGDQKMITAIAALGFGYMLPNRILEFQLKARSRRIRRAVPAALELMVLVLEAGQSIDQALQDTAQALRKIHPDLANEFGFCTLEMRAGTPRGEALRRLGERCGDEEVRKLAAVLYDGDRYGTSLAPALRIHAKYLRTRMRQRAQEEARKLAVKLVIPVFFLIFPSVLLVTLGPAYFQMRQFFDSFLK